MTPFPNLISDERQSRAGVSALLVWDPNLFDGMILPAGVESDLVVSEILNLAAYTPLLHPDPELMKYLIPLWSRKNITVWEKLKATTEFEYNPIENYDRNESYQESRTVSREATSTDSGNSNVVLKSEDAGDNENMVSAENESNYQPDNKTVSTNSNTTNTDTTSSANNKTSAKDTDIYTRTSNVHGNIGVTTTQQMIEEERKIVNFTIYKAIATSFVENFCLTVW